MHKRLGHRATKSILLAKNANLYSDVKIIPDHDPFCTTCKLSTIRAQDRGPVAEERHDTKPGQIPISGRAAEYGQTSLDQERLLSRLS